MKNVVLFLLLTMLVNAQPNSKPSISIKDPWIRPGAKGANTALFFAAENKANKPDTLLSVKFAHSEVSEIHETYKKSDDMMGMRAVKSVTIPSNGSVMFKPRDLHIMLIGLLKDIKIGESYNLSLMFKNAGEVKIKAVVRDMPKMNRMK